MQSKTRVYLCRDDGVRFFGEGPYRLLCSVAETHSLKAAAEKMEMSYTKALSLVRVAEAAVGFSLLARTIGGKSGGGSELTDGAKELMQRYDAYKEACERENSRLFAACFQGFGQATSSADRQ